MASDERLYIATCDIAAPKRGRRVFTAMEAYGRRLRLLVFQCRLAPRRRAVWGARLDGIITSSEARVLIIEVGSADIVEPRVESPGRPFETIKRDAMVV